MMMRIGSAHVFPAICVVAFGMLAPALARSTTLARLSLAQLVESAQAVVHARAIGNKRVWRDGEIWTVTSFRVLESWKGGSPPEIDVWMIGGHIGRLMSYVPGAPRFRPGEETVLFLEPARTGEMSVTAWGEGTFRVHLDRRTGEPRVTQDTAMVSEYQPQAHSFRVEGIVDWPLAVLKMRVLEAVGETRNPK
jgi:hypothetical protein